MSYDLAILKLREGDNKEDVGRIMRGQDKEQDEYDGADFTEEEVRRVTAILLKAGFQESFRKSEPFEYEFLPGVKQAPYVEYQKGHCQFTVSTDGIGMVMPYWEESEPMLPEIEAVVRQICTGRIVCWDGQVGDFVEGGRLGIQKRAFRDGLTNVQSLVQERKPWWRFW